MAVRRLSPGCPGDASATLPPVRRLLLVANPSASGFTGALHRRVIHELSGWFDVTAVWPTNPDEARRMTAEAAADGFACVVAMGGDGVVHHVANGLARTPTALGVIPVGTTNVVARVLGIPAKPDRAASMLTTAEPRSITMAHLATDSGDGARSEFAVFAAGIGYDAEMVHIAEQTADAPRTTSARSTMPGRPPPPCSRGCATARPTSGSTATATGSTPSP